MVRFKNVTWDLRQTSEGNPSGNSDVYCALLMDIRDELQTNNRELAKLNALLNCRNFLDIPIRLRAIDRKLARKRKR